MKKRITGKVNNGSQLEDLRGMRQDKRRIRGEGREYMGEVTVGGKEGRGTTPTIQNSAEKFNHGVRQLYESE